MITPLLTHRRALRGRNHTSPCTSKVESLSAVRLDRLALCTNRPVGVALLALLLLTACDGPSANNAAAPASALSGKAAGANVLLITMDTTRADRIGCYGYKNAVTPSLDSLAAGGVRFAQAFSHAPITLPSHASMLTGVHPPEHGIRDNGRFALGPDLPLLTESFKIHNYRTAAFVSAHVLGARYGLARGFEVYDDEMPKRPDGRSSWDRAGNMTCDRALQWLDAGPVRPFFCWVHFFEPHAPYAPQKTLAPDGDDYDNEIAFMDSQIARLLAWLDEKKLRDNTLIIAVADHGESLGEHGYDWHALLVYESIMRVPMSFTLPGRIPPGTVVSGMTGLVDIMPTVLDLMGWPVPATVAGRSLAPAILGTPLPADRGIYGESDFAWENFGWAKLRCWTEHEWKLIRAPKLELYDRLTDPGELHNRADEKPDIVTRMNAALQNAEGAMTQRDAMIAKVTESDREALGSLGYVGHGAAPSTRDAQQLRNPIEMVDIATRYRMGESLTNLRRADEAIPILEECAAASPESFAIIEMLGKAYAGAGRLDEAAHTLGAALTIYPASAETWEFHARISRARGRLKRAIESCDESLRCDPQIPQVQKLAADLKAEWDATLEEIKALRAAVASENAKPEDFRTLAARLDAIDDVAGAIRTLRDGLERAPSNADILNDLAWTLAATRTKSLRDPAEAVTLARRAVAAGPAAAAGPLDTLAVALAAAGRFDEALDSARRAAVLADDAGDRDFAQRIERRAAMFLSHKPYEEVP